MEQEQTDPFRRWLERVGPAEDFEALHSAYLRTYGRRPLSRMTLVARLRQAGVTVDAGGRLVLPGDWPT